MKPIRTLFCAAALLAATQAGAADLTIHLDDVKAAGGQLMVAVYNSAASFLKTGTGSDSTSAAKTGNTVVIKDLPADEYAFAA